MEGEQNPEGIMRTVSIEVVTPAEGESTAKSYLQKVEHPYMIMRKRL